MKIIKELTSKHFVLAVLGLLTILGVVETQAMPTPKRMQEIWKQRQLKIKQQEEKEHQAFLARLRQDKESQREEIALMKTSPHYEKFEQLLQEDNIKKGWFEGPNTTWKNQIIISAFELLDPNRIAIYDSAHTIRSNNIENAICGAMAEYNKKCWFQTDTAEICSEIITKLNNLIQYSKNPRKVDDSFANRQISSLETFESQDLYNQYLKQRKQGR